MEPCRGYREAETSLLTGTGRAHWAGCRRVFGITKTVAFFVGRSGFWVTDSDDLVGDDPKFPVGALGSVFEDGDGLVLGATESGHQDSLGDTRSVLWRLIHDQLLVN